VPIFAAPTNIVTYDNLLVSNATFSCPSWWDDNAPDWQPVGSN